MSNNEFWSPRPCLLEPVQEIYDAADLLSQAVDHHNNGDHANASELIKQADIPAIAQWTETLWGAKSTKVHRIRQIPDNSVALSSEERTQERMPDASEKKKLIERDGYHCRLCGIPVIDAEVRRRIRKVYPEALRWGRKNSEQHTAFQCMWLTFDHVVPHSRGGDDSLDNMIVTCQPCNCGKEGYVLEELGLIDPRTRPAVQSDWDGLERFKD